ncbi:hypothetical protein H2200_002460 [Cladophialophora chaetospira]|uniref:25S rRNA (Uridine(2843)-N(3))-methyltransferase n=1 Tax=Cladophialophora chaetospira TaxID=386627 RepID=A0AA38XJ16_9EURO|nr:hypothetical protein H2200_002460 [Cladophialophora chaetospira]
MAPPKKQKDFRTRQTSSQQGGTGSAPASQQRSDQEAASLPLELQQLLLDVFQRAFPFDHNELDLKATIQKVKGHLFQREFALAFAKQEYLDAYALRWSASRALGYTSIFSHHDLQQVWSKFDKSAGSAPTSMPASPDSSLQGEPPSHASACRVVCIGGGGGAEVAACAAAARTFRPFSTKLSVHVVDIADWSTCVRKLETALKTPPELSIHASQSAKAANKAFVAGDSFDVRFSQHDIFAVTEAELVGLMQDARLCTIMFTLNELFSASISRATALLLALTEAIRPGSWLLVVDSPGSYSEVELGKGDDAKTKQYPMKWLLDHALLEVVGKGENSKWKKMVSDDSRWFRLPQKSALRYPIELENMRYQIHLYQRVEPTGSSVRRS